MQRLDWPAPYTAPESVAQQLWAIEPGVELLYLAEGQWALVSRPAKETMVDNGWRRRRTGLNILLNERKKGRENPVTMRAAQLLVHGCAIVTQKRFDGEPAFWEILHWFKEADWRLRMGEFEKAMDSRDAESNGDAQDARMQLSLEDWRNTVGRDSWRHVFKKPHSIVVNRH